MYYGKRNKLARVARKILRPRKSSFNARNKLKHSKVAKYRMKVRIWKVVFMAVGIFLLVSALSLLSFSNFIAIQTLSISGNNRLSTIAIESHIDKMTKTPYAIFFSKNNIFTFPSKQVQSSLYDTFPNIKTVRVRINFLQRKVAISVVERSPYVLWCKSTSAIECYFADGTGYIYEKAKDVIATSTKYIIFENTTSNTESNPLRKSISFSYFENIRTFIRILETRGYTIRKIAINGIDGEVTVAPGWKVKIALDKDLSITAYNLLDVIEKSSIGAKLNSIEYIDMRFNRRVYYKIISQKSDNSMKIQSQEMP